MKQSKPKIRDPDENRGVSRFSPCSKVRTGRFGDWFLGEVRGQSQIRWLSNLGVTQARIESTKIGAILEIQCAIHCATEPP